MQRVDNGSEPSHQQAPQVCRRCKASKRKCNKALPACSACLKRRLRCIYETTPSGSSLSGSTAVSDQLSPYSPDHHGPKRREHAIDFPTVTFLEPTLLQHGQLSLWEAKPSGLHDARALLGSADDLNVAVERYFQNIHRWLPFISKTRLYDRLPVSDHSSSDTILLLLTIKLVATPPPTSPQNPRTTLYHAVKHFYLDVEGSSTFSMPLLQAGVLLALYDLCHGIYPAAYLSIGSCARLAYALGINTARAVPSKRALTLIDTEERRRVWWAIVVLDRFVNVGCPGRPLATAEPGVHATLPSDDEAWDQGIVRSDDSSTLSIPTSGHMRKFALICQAARLLGQVFDHVSSDEPAADDMAFWQLDRTLQSMLTASLDIPDPDYDQISLIYSVLVALHTPWLPGNRFHAPESEHSQHADAVIQQISDRISTNVIQNQCLSNRDLEAVPPWGLFFAYRVCAVQMRSRDQTSDSAKVAEDLKNVLRNFDVRWNVAGQYLQLLEAQDLMVSG